MALARSPIRTISPKFYTLTDIVTLLLGPHKYEKFEFCYIWAPLLVTWVGILILATPC
jgi:hypothetical protein